MLMDTLHEYVQILFLFLLSSAPQPASLVGMRWGREMRGTIQLYTPSNVQEFLF